MRTAGMIQQGTPNPDGHMYFPVNTSHIVSGAAGMTRAAKGITYLNIAASTAIILDIPISSVLFRYGVQDDLQQFWGSSTGNVANGAAIVPPAVYNTPGPQLTRAPYTGASQLTPPTSRPTGILIKNITLVSALAGTISLNSIGISKTQFSPVVAPNPSIVTDILAPVSGSTGANFSVTIPVNSVIPNNFLTSRLAEYIVEWQITTGAGAAAFLYGFFLDLAYNYN